MNELAELLIKNNISIGTVESFTVGNFATMLGNIPGISKVYKGSLVTYQSETKERLLGIEHPLIEKYGVVSKEIATLMCVNGKSILDVDLCISFTGNAGPDAMEGKPVGEVYIGIAYEDVVVYKLNLEGSRKEIALSFGCAFLLKFIFHLSELLLLFSFYFCGTFPRRLHQEVQ